MARPSPQAEERTEARAARGAGMLGPRREEIAASLERGKQRGEVRADLDSHLAVEALMGGFVYHSLAVGRPAKGWSEQAVDMLWPVFAATR